MTDKDASGLVERLREAAKTEQRKVLAVATGELRPIVAGLDAALNGAQP